MVCRLVALLFAQVRNVVIEPVALQFLCGHGLGPRDPASADSFTCSAGTLECLIHVPLGAGVEEGEGVAGLQWPIIHDAHLHTAHIEVQGGCARVVTVDQVGIELNVGVGASLHAGVCFRAGSGRGDLGEDSPRGEINKRVSPASEGFGAAVDAQTIGMGRRREPTGVRGGDRVCGWGHIEE